MIRFIVVVTFLCLYQITQAQDCQGIVDTIRVCAFQTNIELQNDGGNMAWTCPTPTSHLVFEQDAAAITVNECGEFSLSHSYTNTTLNCEVTDIYVLQFDDPSGQAISTEGNLSVNYGDQETHKGGEADCESPSEIKIGGVPPPIIEWEQCNNYTSSTSIYSGEVIFPNNPSQCVVDSIAIQINGDSQSSSNCSGFLQSDFYEVVGVDFEDLVAANANSGFSDWLSTVLDVPTNDCDFFSSANTNFEVDTIVNIYQDSIPIRVRGNWAIIQNGEHLLLQDTTSLVFQNDSNYVFFIYPGADYIGPDSLSFELLYDNGVDTVFIPESQSFDVEWIEFWEYEYFTVIDTLYQTTAMGCGGLSISSTGGDTPPAPPSPFGPIPLDFPSACECEEIIVYEDYGIACPDSEGCVSGFGSSTLGEVIIQFENGSDFICGGPGAYPFTAISVETGCTETGVSYIESYYPIPVYPYVKGLITCATPCVEIGIESFDGYVEVYWIQSSGPFFETGTYISVCEAGVYEALVFDDFGCQTIVTVVVEEDMTEPFVDLLATITEITCQECPFIFANTDVPPNCVWMDGNNNIISEGQNIEVCQSGIYEVVVVNQDNGCTASASIEIHLDADIPDVIIEATNEVLTCESPCTELSAQTSILDPIYNWSDGSDSQSINVCEAGTYSVNIINPSNGCMAQHFITIVEDFVNSNSEILIVGSTSFCSGSSTTLQVVLDPNTEEEYLGCLWSNGSDTEAIIVDQEGCYSVTVFTQNACTAEAEICVTENSILQPTIQGALEICAGSSTTLDAGSGFETYLWNTGETTQTVTIDYTATCVVTVTDASGCTGEAAVNIIVNENPSPQILGQTEFCSDNNPTISVEGDFVDYQWATGETTSSILAYDGACYVTVTDANACTGTATINLTEIEPPILEDNLSFTIDCNSPFVYANGNFDVNLTYQWISSDGSIVSTEPNPPFASSGEFTCVATNSVGCSATTIVSIQEDTTAPTIEIEQSNDLDCIYENSTLFVNSDFDVSYEWFFEGNPIANEASIEIDQAGSYALLVTNYSNGCTSEETIIIENQIENIEVNLESTSITCTESGTASVQTTADLANATIIWTGPNNFTANTPDIQVTASGTYQVILTTVTGCSGNSEIFIDADNAIPTLELTSSSNIDCQTPFSTLAAISNASDIVWSFDGFVIGNSQFLEITQGGIYTAEATLENGCTNSQTIEVIENTEIPTVEVSADTLSCCNSEALLLGLSNLPNTSFEWTGPNGFSSNQESPMVSIPGDYTLTVVAENGCSNTTTVEVVAIMDIEALSANTVGTLTCAESTVQLDIIEMNDVSYNWTGPNGFSSTLANPMVSEAGFYTLTAINQYCCESSLTIEVQENIQAPTIFVPDYEIACQETTIIAIPESNMTNLDFEWSNNNTFQSNAEQASLSEAGSYQLIVSNTENGCTNSTNFEVSQVEPIEVAFSTEASCEGTEAGSITLDLLQGGSGTYTIEWSNIATNEFSVSNLNPGSYEYLITDSGDCFESGILDIPVSPSTVFTNIEELDICPDEQVLLNPKENYDIQETALVEWDNGSNSINQLISEEGIYSVSISQNCEIQVHTYQVNQIEDKARQFYIPDAFSPNNDGVNDTFLAFAAKEVERYQLSIFDRWGNLLFQNQNIDQGWNGMLENNTLKNGIFIYHLQADVKDCRGDIISVEKYGDVTLIR